MWLRSHATAGGTVVDVVEGIVVVETDVEVVDAPFVVVPDLIVVAFVGPTVVDVRRYKLSYRQPSASQIKRASAPENIKISQ